MAAIQDMTDSLLELEEELEKFRASTELIGEAKKSATDAVGAAEAVRASAAKVVAKVDGFAGQATNVLKRIESVDFPTRLDKLDATVSGINGAVQNVIGRLESVESNLKQSVETECGKVTSQLEAALTKQQKELLDHMKSKLGRIEADQVALQQRLNWVLGLAGTSLAIGASVLGVLLAR